MELYSKKFDDASDALKTLKEALAVEYSVFIRDAAIQRFEYTTEALWKCVQTYLKEHEGIACASPKACFREAKKVGILNDEEVMLTLEMIDDRNLASHTYHEDVANRIFGRLQGYAVVMTKILARCLESYAKND